MTNKVTHNVSVPASLEKTFGSNVVALQTPLLDQVGELQLATFRIEDLAYRPNPNMEAKYGATPLLTESNEWRWFRPSSKKLYRF